MRVGLRIVVYITWLLNSQRFYFIPNDPFIIILNYSISSIPKCFLSNKYYYNELFAFMYSLSDVFSSFCEYIIIIISFLHFSSFLTWCFIFSEWKEVKPFINNTWSIFHKKKFMQTWNNKMEYIGKFFIMIYILCCLTFICCWCYP